MSAKPREKTAEEVFAETVAKAKSSLIEDIKIGNGEKRKKSMRTRLSTGSIHMLGTTTYTVVKELENNEVLNSRASTPDSIISVKKSTTPPTNVAGKKRSNTSTPEAKIEGVVSQENLGVPPKRRKIGRNDGSGEDNRNDYFCWLCHKEGMVICCELCPRVYHAKCLELSLNLPKDWVCPECEKIMRAECIDTRSKAMSMISIDTLCTLLKYALDRMKHQGSDPFLKPVDTNAVSFYTDYIYNPMDLSQLEKNIKKKLYGCTEAFLADAKWILHNCIIFNGTHHKLTSSAKMIIKICKHEMSEIELCPDCYWNSCVRKNDQWFSEPCRTPHPLCWAKLKGYPFWPAKALREVGPQVDVRFFGAHDRSLLPMNQVYMLSKDVPTPVKNKKGGYENAIVELDLHIAKLEEKFGKFHYAPNRTPYDKNYEYIQNLKKVTVEKPLSTKHGKRFSPKKSDKLSVASKKAFAVRNKYSNMCAARKLIVNLSSISSIVSSLSSTGTSTSSPENSVGSASDLISPKLKNIFVGTSVKIEPSEYRKTSKNGLHCDKLLLSPKVKLTRGRTIADTLQDKIKLMNEVSKDIDEPKSEKSSRSSTPVIDSSIEDVKLKHTSGSSGVKSRDDETVNTISPKPCSLPESSESLPEDDSETASNIVPKLTPDKKEYVEKLARTIQSCKDKLGISGELEENDEDEEDSNDSDEEDSEQMEDEVVLATKEPQEDEPETSDATDAVKPQNCEIQKARNDDETKQEDKDELRNPDQQQKSFGKDKVELSIEEAKKPKPELVEDSAGQPEGLGQENKKCLEKDKDSAIIVTKTSLPDRVSKKPEGSTGLHRDDKQSEKKDVYEDVKKELNLSKDEEKNVSNATGEAMEIEAEDSSSASDGSIVDPKLSEDEEHEFDVDEKELDVRVIDEERSKEEGNSSKDSDMDCVHILTDSNTPGSHGKDENIYSISPPLKSIRPTQNKAIVPTKTTKTPQRQTEMPTDTSTKPLSHTGKQSLTDITKDPRKEIIKRFSTKLANSVKDIFEETCSEFMDQQEFQPQAAVKDLMNAITKMQWSQHQQMLELRHNFKLTMVEMKSCWNLEKERLVAELKQKASEDKEKAIQETKQKQWCANCGKEAIFYCCWNTSYCDYPCQQAHWPKHMSSCMQSQQNTTTSQESTTDKPSSTVSTSSAGTAAKTSQSQILVPNGITGNKMKVESVDNPIFLDSPSPNQTVMPQQHQQHSIVSSNHTSGAALGQLSNNRNNNSSILRNTLHQSQDFSNRGSVTWSDRVMADACNAVINNGLSVNKASKVYQVPRTKLTAKLSEKQQLPISSNVLTGNQMGQPPVGGPQVIQYMHPTNQVILPPQNVQHFPAPQMGMPTIQVGASQVHASNLMPPVHSNNILPNQQVPGIQPQQLMQQGSSLLFPLQMGANASRLSVPNSAGMMGNIVFSQANGPNSSQFHPARF